MGWHTDNATLSYQNYMQGCDLETRFLRLKFILLRFQSHSQQDAADFT